MEEMEKEDKSCNARDVGGEKVSVCVCGGGGVRKQDGVGRGRGA